MTYEVRCSVCGHSSSDLLDFACTSCGQPLEVQLHLTFERRWIRKNDHSMWRYRTFFPYAKESDIVTLGEGWTPLTILCDNVYAKLENLNPTGSFKDRGTAALFSAIRTLIKRKGGFISEDSSGNAGASMAAYAARAGLRAKIYVPQTVSGPKFNQVRIYGAEVVKVSGSRSKVAEAAQKREPRKFYVGHILHPLFRDGIRSLAYEITEELDWRVPEEIYLPVSAGTLLLGVISGFRHLLASGVIKSIPKIVACQTRQVAPLYHRLKNLSYKPPEMIDSVADALVSVDPPLLDLMVKNMEEVEGDAVVVEEKEIIDAFRELAGRGFYVEPSSAVAYAGFKKHVGNKETSKDRRAVVVLTGMGLKAQFVPELR